MHYGLDDLRRSVEHSPVRAPAVSQWTVGMQIHHCCLAMIGICEALTESTPPPPPRRWSPITTIVFLGGRIPRGKGKAPKEALPNQDVSADELRALLDKSERMLQEAGELDPGRWFKHFAFGILDRDKSLKLLRIHNGHHLRIIGDIVAAAVAGQK